MSGKAWPCGHPRTPENTQKVGVAGVRCRECRRRISREWVCNHRAGKPNSGCRFTMSTVLP